MKGNVNPGIDFSDVKRYANLGIDWFCCRYSEEDYLDSREEKYHKQFLKSWDQVGNIIYQKNHYNTYIIE